MHIKQDAVKFSIVVLSVTIVVNLFVMVLFTSAREIHAVHDDYDVHDDSDVLIENDGQDTANEQLFIDYSLVVENNSSSLESESETCTEETVDYSYDDLYLLAQLIMAESGSDWCSDEMQLYTGSVVLNRVSRYEFPDTIFDVVYSPGQYACVLNGSINNVPNERALSNAEYLLKNGSQLPENVVFQAEFLQGDGVYAKIQNMYFCYVD